MNFLSSKGEQGVRDGSAPDRNQARTTKQVQQTAGIDPDVVYDEIVHAGHPGQDEDVFDRFARTDLNVDADVVATMDSEDLVAALEGKSSELVDDTLADETTWDESISVRGARARNEDDGGTVSPDDLGEQFLQNAVQQDRRTSTDDAEPAVTDETQADAGHTAFDHMSAKREAIRRAQEAQDAQRLAARHAQDALRESK